ncbi:hypothetical protein L1D44_04000 [Shewanella sp. Isolate13]|uniref:hypothetical protein n=1 Tax=Shewanella sp. Isolate13 TaxID=2908531 RepID=UPI001EFDA708|nr:hypothetical protein [Shewanella sp. Isolate13]MCG9729007.1 hypothetical protein [Shewanella sp. Isolate13]
MSILTVAISVANICISNWLHLMQLKACGQRMCRYFRDTLQVHPWRLGHDKQYPYLKASSASQPLARELDNSVISHQIMDGHGRIYTELEKHDLSDSVLS